MKFQTSQLLQNMFHDWDTLEIASINTHDYYEDSHSLFSLERAIRNLDEEENVIFDVEISPLKTSNKLNDSRERK